MQTSAQIDSNTPKTPFIDELEAKGYQVLFGFIGRDEDSKGIYDSEEAIHKAINKCALEHVKFGVKQGILQKSVMAKKKKGEEFYSEYSQCPSVYFPKGVSSAINSILDSYDQDAVFTAIIAWATNPRHSERKRVQIRRMVEDLHTMFTEVKS